MRESRRIFVFALSGLLGACFYTFLIAFADYVYFTVFLTHSYQIELIDSLPYSFPIGVVMGITSASIWWSYQANDVEGAAKICHNWGVLAFIASGTTLLLLLNEYWDRGFPMLLAQMFRFFLGWGAPFGWSIVLLFAPHLPIFWNRENRS